MPVEVCSYRLSVKNRPAGSHVLRAYERGRALLLEAKLMLQGSLGQYTVEQRSRSSRRSLASFQFQESTQSRSNKRSFEMTFDKEAGLVRMVSGNSDNAEIPYLLPFRDPLGLLYQVRRLGEDTAPLKVPMLGREVDIRQLGTVTLETVFGEKEARAYQLRPGNSYLYVDTEPPHAILHMTQPFEGKQLDAFIVKIHEEKEPEDEVPPTSSRKRRRRRRRRRNKS